MHKQCSSSVLCVRITKIHCYCKHCRSGLGHRLGNIVGMLLRDFLHEENAMQLVELVSVIVFCWLFVVYFVAVVFSLLFVG